MKKQLLLLVMMLLPMVARADESGACGDNLTWTYVEDTKTLTISGTGNMYGYSAGLSPWNGFRENIQTLAFEDSVTSIGNNAFYGCSGISTIVIPSGVALIDRGAFLNCVGLTSVKIGESVKTIGANAFQGCISLTSIDIPDGVKTIGNNAFQNCENLISVTLGSDITTILSRTFSGCINLYSATIGANVTSIQECAFSGCESLTQLIMNSTLSTIGRYAFEGCRSLKSISLPSNLKSIESWAFFGCEGITTLYIPESVTHIFMGAFEGCRGLTSIVVDEKNSNYDSRDNCNAIIETSSNSLIAGCSMTRIPNSVTSIGSLCFAHSNISTLNIPSSVQRIENASFAGCSELAQINIPSGVSYIGWEVFRNCTSLASIIIPDGVKSIEPNTFEGCLKLSNIELGSGIETIKSNAFNDCQSLTKFTCRANNPPSAPFNSIAAFTNIALSSIDLYVPATSVDLYKHATPWKYFGMIRAIGNSFNVKLTSNGNGQINYKSNVVRNTTFTYEVESEEGVYLTIVPDEGNSLESFNNNGINMGDNLTFSIDNLTEDIDISVTFVANKYTLKYIVDDVEYKTVEYEYGSSITPELEPTKEGYTFSGWSKIPEMMPAHDVTITGTFSINKYKLTYTVDGEEYKIYDVEYGATITAEAAPTKEGYTFSGWSEIPETMPAHDVTVTGTFSINSYKLIYTVDGEEYKNYEVEYGTIITPEAVPTKEGYTFSGWGEIPEAMPAHDVTVTGTFSVNSYKLTYMIDNEIYKETMYEYGATITSEPQPEGNYQTFEWTDLPRTMPAHDVVVHASYTSGIKEVLMASKENVRIYSLNGKKLNKLQKGLNIVIIDDGTVKKVIVK